MVRCEECFRRWEKYQEHLTRLRGAVEALMDSPLPARASVLREAERAAEACARAHAEFLTYRWAHHSGPPVRAGEPERNS
jgi:hypothetical protein